MLQEKDRIYFGNFCIAQCPLHNAMNFVSLSYIKNASVKPHMHLLSLHIVHCLNWASAGGFTKIPLFNNLSCRKAFQYQYFEDYIFGIQ